MNQRILIRTDNHYIAGRQCSDSIPVLRKLLLRFSYACPIPRIREAFNRMAEF